MEFIMVMMMIEFACFAAPICINLDRIAKALEDKNESK
jgi:hypothetical protein